MSAVRKAIRFEDVPWRRNDDARDWLNYKRLIWSETGSNDLCVGVGSLDPGKILGLHHHPEDAEFYYVLSGSAKVTVDDEEIDATPGTAIYIPAAAKHRILNDGGEKFVFVYGLNAGTRRHVYDEPPE
ncbi:MAG: cupin domain-containing protein [Candidatus Bathyarchaeota archaeon]|nr:MAG: cupin domain-containing protein [Candidatus Bathyarchaeota archaeon]